MYWNIYCTNKSFELEANDTELFFTIIQQFVGTKHKIEFLELLIRMINLSKNNQCLYINKIKNIILKTRMIV